MATDQLNHVVEAAKLLSREELKIASQRILDMLDEMEWDAIWKKPEARALARKLADEAQEDEVEDGGFDGL